MVFNWYIHREKSTIWEDEKTILVFISDRLKAGQIRGVSQSPAKKEKSLKELQQELVKPKATYMLEEMTEVEKSIMICCFSSKND